MQTTVIKWYVGNMDVDTAAAVMIQQRLAATITLTTGVWDGAREPSVVIEYICDTPGSELVADQVARALLAAARGEREVWYTVERRELAKVYGRDDT